VHANLVGSAGEGSKAQEGKSLSLGKGLVLGDGFFPFGGHTEAAGDQGIGSHRGNDAASFSRGACHHRQVGLFHLLAGKGLGAKGRRIVVLGKKQEAAGHPVQAVDNKKLEAVAFPVGKAKGEHLPSGKLSRQPFFAGLGEHARRLGTS
jgi:hypothetical protein